MNVRLNSLIFVDVQWIIKYCFIYYKAIPNHILCCLLLFYYYLWPMCFICLTYLNFSASFLISTLDVISLRLNADSCVFVTRELSIWVTLNSLRTSSTDFHKTSFFDWLQNEKCCYCIMKRFCLNENCFYLNFKIDMKMFLAI